MTSTHIMNYNIRKELGKGAYGKVFDCTDINGIQKAIKEVKDEYRFKMAALKEIKILRILTENNIEQVPIIKYEEEFIDKGIQYIVFEYMDTDLYRYYRKHSISYEETINIFYDTALGLEYIHSQKIIHADLKPENIMINVKTKKTKIIDLGSAMFDNDNTNFFYIQSRYYRAPEILFNIEITNAIDIWSLGCIIYELMFKIPLFPAKDKNDLVYLLTTLLGLPTIISRYFISPKHDYYFVFCKVNGRYIRRPTIKYYKPCDEFGLTTKLYKEIDIDIEEKEVTAAFERIGKWMKENGYS